MNHTVKFGVFFTFLVVTGELAAENAGPSAKDWVEQYTKLGGVAFLGTKDKHIIGIQKREGQKPLISLKGLKPAAGVKRVWLQGFEVADEDLEAMAGWKELEQIDVFDGKKVTDKGAKALAALPKLRELVLADTAVTATGANAFSGHNELIHLTVTNTLLENKVSSLDLSEMPKLQTLTIICQGVTSVRLTKLPKLREISEFPAELEVAEFSELGSLTELDFRSTRLKKLTISGLPKLEMLNISKTRLDADAVAEIHKSFPFSKERR